MHLWAPDVFLVQSFEFQYFWGIFRKLNIFGSMKILWIFFWGYHKIGLLNLEVISMHFRLFSEGQDTEWRIFFGLLLFFFSIFIWDDFFFFWGGVEE